MSIIHSIGLIFSVATGAFLLSSIAGGGASSIIIPLLSLRLPVDQVPAALVTGTFSSALSRVVVMRQHIRGEIVRWFVPTALPSVVVGAWLLAYVDPLVVMWLTGLFLVGNIVTMLYPGTSDELDARTRKPSRGGIMVAAVAGGLISGLTGAIGLLLNRFYIRSGLTKEEVVATRAANELLLHIVKVICYARMGLFKMEALELGLVIAIAAVFSTIVVRLILPFVNESVFRRIGSTAMVLSGAVLMGRATSQIVEERHPSFIADVEPNEIESHILWSGRRYTFEIDGDGDLTIERKLSRRQIPSRIQAFAKRVGGREHRFVVEECLGFRGKFYEVQLLERGRFHKFDVLRDGTPSETSPLGIRRTLANS